jgi:hypothetical protein
MRWRGVPSTVRDLCNGVIRQRQQPYGSFNSARQNMLVPSSAGSPKRQRFFDTATFLSERKVLCVLAWCALTTVRARWTSEF